jgi:transglutaminase/protease-like cytokinesis protein 3
MKKIAFLLYSCVVLTIAAALCYIFFFNAQRTFRIIETYKITSESDSKTWLNVCLPISGGYQEITDLIVEGAEAYTLENYDGWRELTATVPSIGSESLVTISYTVKLIRNTQPWNGEVLDDYTKPQQYVDSDSDDITRLGEQLHGGNNYETAKNILKYVHKFIHLPSGSRDNQSQLTASELLKNPVGVCGDYAILMTALLRAEGIPSRKISGLTLSMPLKKAGDWNHRGIAHAWVEFYADGKWHFADPTWGLFDRSDTAHLSYGVYESNIQSDFQQKHHKAIEDAGYFISGGMSSPLMFTVYSTDENCSVTPQADVSFSWFN